MKIIHKIDAERQQICRVLDFEAMSKSERSVRSGYFGKSASLQKQYNHSPVLADIQGPADLENRYVTEDVSNGLVLWASIGDAACVKKPEMNAVISLASELIGRVYFN